MHALHRTKEHQKIFHKTGFVNLCLFLDFVDFFVGFYFLKLESSTVPVAE